MNLREGLGFQHLSQQEQQAYRVILKAFFSMAASINCSQLSKSVDLMKVLHAALGDNPSVIYFDKTKIEIEESVFVRRLYFSGVKHQSETEEMIMSTDTISDEIAASVMAASNDDFSLLINLYVFLQEYIQYDKEELQANSRGISNNPGSHNAYGALVKGLAVCDGFSSAFALLAQKLGFECMLVVGRSAYTSTAVQDHAWNIIKVRDRFYHMDLTWDARKCSEFGESSYVYFALPDEEIASDHNWERTSTPMCSSHDFSYYKKNGLFANSIEHLCEIVEAFGRNPSNVFRVKLSRNIELSSNAGDYLAQMILNEVVRPGERKQASSSWNENTRCFFAKIM